MTTSNSQNHSQITDCPHCQGWAVLRSKQGQATCGKCSGLGSTLTIGRRRLIFDIPPITAYGTIALKKLFIIIRNISLIAAAFLTSVIAFKLINLGTTGMSLTEIYTQRGFWSALFWLLVLVDGWSIYLFDTRDTPVHYLSELDNPRSKMINSQIDGLSFFTNDAKKLIAAAFENTEAAKKTILTKELLFLTLLQNPKVQLIFARLEINYQDLLNEVKEYFKKAEPDGIIDDSIIIAPPARKIILASINEAISLGFNHIDIEDILLAFLRDPGAIGPLLTEMDISFDKVRAVSLWVAEEQENVRAWAFWRKKGRRQPRGNMNRAWTSLPTPFLDRYSQDLTKMASWGALPIVRVRDKEIKSILTILSRTEKNNALLVGDPGVGKTSIVGAIAERVLTEDVPEPLKDKRLVSLDLGALASGRGSAEENTQRVLSEVERAGNIILYLSHIEALIGTSGGGFDAGALLTDALSRGHFQIIAAATPADRHRYVESNPSLASLFQIIEIPEVSQSDAIVILEEEAPKIEGHQRVLLTYPAIKAAVELSYRLIPDKVLPDKAIEVIDQAATLAASENIHWVTDDYVIRVMKERTNVPVEQVTQEEGKKLLNLENLLKQRIIGQDQAVHAIVEALKRARVGLKDEKRPMGSFLFVGPTGVGKTETAKALAASYFGDEEAMVRFDMSEYQDRESVYQLIGPPPKSDKFVEGGSLTTPVREKPFSLILLDEFEKSHPDVTTLFLQVLDDGRLTENTGRTVSFANTIIIATSNAGTKEVSQMLVENKSVDEIQTNLSNILKDYFRPELLNRFDGVIIFGPMTRQMLLVIATNMIQAVVQNLSVKQGISLTVHPDATAYLAEKGFDPVFGARPLRRVIQDKLETKLADILLQKKVQKGGSIIITLEMIK